MNRIEWFNSIVSLPSCVREVLGFVPKSNETIDFVSEPLTGQDGYQSDIRIGYIIHTDSHGKRTQSKYLLLKIFPEFHHRSSFTELVFRNETYVYNTVIPFLATLKDTFLDLFPKFYYSHMEFNHQEDGFMVMENLTESAYRSTACKTFLDLKHLLLAMKKLGEFHAYSYEAKRTSPKMFYSLVDNLIQTHWIAMGTLPNIINIPNDHLFESFSQDPQLSGKIQQIRQFIGSPEKFCKKIFSTVNEPIAVLCHGDFLRNNLMYKYDDNDDPIDIKFVDLGIMMYCTPIVDLGLVLYMNTDQPMRDKYWDLLIDTYYDSLKNTFPGNDLVPSKDQLVSEFRYNILQPYLISALFVPWMMTNEESNNVRWYQELFLPHYEEYMDLPSPEVPEHVLIYIMIKMLAPHRAQKSLEALRDIISRGFV